MIIAVRGMANLFSNFSRKKRKKTDMGKEATQFKKGNSGRPAGVPNVLTRTVKETVLAVFNKIQTDPKNNLESFALKYPRDFYQIAAKLIPTEITGTIKTVYKVTRP